MKHWTQTAAGKAKARRNAKKMWEEKRAREASSKKVEEHSPSTDEVESNGGGAILTVNKDGVVTTHVSDMEVWPHDNEGTTAFQLGDVIVKVNGRRIA